MKALFLFLLFIPINAFAAFPNLYCLEKNVNFWESIYLKYGENEGVVHNTETFEVYMVVKLPSRDQKKTRKSAVENALKTVRSLNSNIPKEHIRLQNGIKEKFAAGLERSYSYLPRILPKLNGAQLPQEIGLLPHMESSFDSTAVSKVGAIGLWQIMRSTARLFGFKTKEELRDPEKSTEAAIAILNHKYQRAAKNWPIALTAYNHGISGMVKAMQKTNSADLCTIVREYESRSFGFASKNFYAQFLAVQKIVLPIYAERKIPGWHSGE